jgi:predicted nucleotidyltransferase
MGNQLNETTASSYGIRPCPPWLDTSTAALLEDLIETGAQAFPDLLAIILYGSIARHDERPSDDKSPSDVDLLAIFDTDDEHFVVKRARYIFPVLGEAKCRHLDAPRDVNVMLASRTLREWDPTFIANVARDGIVLFARGPLPDRVDPSEASYPSC